MEKFKVGDVLMGTSNGYAITGKGSIVKVVKVVDKNRIEVEIIESKPNSVDPEFKDMPFEVGVNYFIKVDPKSAKVLYGS